MVCDYAIVICPKTGEQCDHKNCMSDCARAKVNGIRHATFGDCLKIYQEHADVCKEHKRSVQRRVRAILELLGLTEASPIDALTYRRAKEFIQKLENRTYQGRKLGPHTVARYIDSLRSITSDIFRDNFDELGFSRPVLDLPRYKEPKRKVIAMTQEQDCLVDSWMRHLSESQEPIE